jgi:hypothetical protein
MGLDGTTFNKTSYLDTVTGGVSAVVPLAFRISGSEKMRVHTDGNVGIGTTNPYWTLSTRYAGGNDSSTATKLNFGAEIHNSTASGDNNRPNLLLFTDFNSTQGAMGAFRRAFNTDFSGGLVFYVGSQPAGYTQATPTTTAQASGSLTEAMRIDYNGRVGIGTTNPLNFFGLSTMTEIYGNNSGVVTALAVDSGAMPNGDVVYLTKRYTFNYIIRMDSVPNAYPANFIFFATNNGATNPGTITATNATTMVYGSSSDYRIKSNVVPLSNSIEFINKLRPVNFTFNENPTEVVGGFIAHEIQELIPHAVTGVKDDVDENGKMRIQNLDVSFVVPYLTAAVKDLVVKNTSLETQLQTAQNDIDLLESRLAAIEALISTNTSADTTTSYTGTRSDALLAEAGAV